jgi:parvulin-like peptidyl-prolyl isomerase
VQAPALRLSHILVEHRYEAEDLLRNLADGKSFAELARARSRCASAARGGDLGPVALSRLDPDFAEAAAALAPGETSAVARTRFGYHLIFRHA